MMTAEKFQEHMENLESCVNDLQVESLLLSLLVNSPDIDGYNPEVVKAATFRTTEFIGQFVDSLAIDYDHLRKAMTCGVDLIDQ